MLRTRSPGGESRIGDRIGRRCSVRSPERGSVLKSTAVVATDAPERYAKQLLSHLGRKNTVVTVAGERQGGRLVFAYGTATVRPEDNQLVLEAAAEHAESLAHIEDVLARHLERFVAKRELAVTWQRGNPDGIAG